MKTIMPASPPRQSFGSATLNGVGETSGRMVATSGPMSMTAAQRRWGVDQWVAWLRDKEIPALPVTRDAIQQLVDEERTESISPREMTSFLMRDPLFALRLLRKAEQVRSRHLDHDTTTMLATVLQLGFKRLRQIAEDAPLADTSPPGFIACTQRTVLAARIGFAWAAHHADVSPDEVAFAALLSETGELMLWAFVPDLPGTALAMLETGRASRNAEAQEAVAGFLFRNLTLSLAASWQLPQLLTQLIKGSDSLRANIARLAIDTARHLLADPWNPAIPSDLREIHALLPGVSFENLLAPLDLDPEFRETVLVALTEN